MSRSVTVSVLVLKSTAAVNADSARTATRITAQIIGSTLTAPNGPDRMALSLREATQVISVPLRILSSRSLRNWKPIPLLLCFVLVSLCILPS